MASLLTAFQRLPVDFRTLLYLVTVAVPRGALSRAAAGRRAAPRVECDPALRDPAFLAPVMDLFEALARSYFRAEVRGVEHVPAEGAALVVGNHNGGIVNTDSYLTMLAIWRQYGPRRALCPLAHDFVFFDPVLGRLAQRMGVLSAGHEAAGRAFARGDMVLVYPGSDLDTWRPFGDRGRIELGQRRGSLRLALGRRVPIVPVVSAGTHEQFIALARGDELARRLGLKRTLRAEPLPLVLSLPWGLTRGYLPYLPLPAQTTLQFGAPIRFGEVEPGQADDPATLERCYEQVRVTMQSLLDSVTCGRRWLLGQPRAARGFEAPTRPR